MPGLYFFHMVSYPPQHVLELCLLIGIQWRDEALFHFAFMGLRSVIKRLALFREHGGLRIAAGLTLPDGHKLLAFQTLDHADNRGLGKP